MLKFLKYCTAVGDDHTGKWHDEDGELHEASEELGPATGLALADITFRGSLKRLYSSDRFQLLVVGLVILDAFFVLGELLIDLSVIKLEHGHLAPEVLHYLSLALLTFFIVELLGKLYAYRLEFFLHKFEVFDGVVVIVSFALDIAFIGEEGSSDGMGLLILLRLWRVARIVNGIIVSVKARADHKVERLKVANDHLIKRNGELQEGKVKMEEENSKLRALLRQHNIEY